MNEVRLIDANVLAERVKRYISVAGKDAIVKFIEDEPTVTGWISVEDKLPELYGIYLGVVNGKWRNITFEDAVEFVEYDPETKEWFLEEYPGAHGVKISYWMDIPPAPPHKETPQQLRDGDNYKAIGPMDPTEKAGDADEVRA